ncbi:MAG: AraC family transcriptional regulator [Fusicatenibacter sp.]|nr:AraC family transcriptional regulator [Fusicatenibacter sp.]
MEFSKDTLLLVNYGRQDCSDLHSWGPGMRSCYVIHYVISGSGFLEYQKKRWHLKAGQSFLICPYMTVLYYPDKEDPWEYVWVDFVGKEVGAFLERCSMNESHPICGFLSWKKLSPVFEQLGTIDPYQTNRKEAGGLLVTLLGIYEDAFGAVDSKRKVEGDHRLEMALILIQSNYHKNQFHVETLCDMMHMSRVTLYRLFLQHIGSSPADYLLSYRLKQAKKLLIMGMSVKGTAISCGFSDPFYFSKVFKKQMGISPSEYEGEEQV